MYEKEDQNGGFKRHIPAGFESDIVTGIAFYAVFCGNRLSLDLLQC